MTVTPLPFPLQRVVFFSLLFGMTACTIAAAILLQQNGGNGLAEAAVPQLDDASLWVGCTSAVLAMILRVTLGHFAARQAGAARRRLRFHQTLVPLVVLEVGCLTAVTAWLVNGKAVPALAIALVLLALAIAIVPFKDPDDDPRP